MFEKQLKSKKVYDCSFLEMYEDDVLLQNGKTSKRVYVKHIGAACVLPITKDGLLILTKQYRYPIRSISIEVPAGKKDSKEESGYDCIKREIEEETGYQSDEFTHVYDIHNCVGYSDELIEVYIAKNCYKVDNPLPPDEDEFIEISLYTVDEALDLIRNKKITDVKTIVAIQHYVLTELR